MIRYCLICGKQMVGVFPHKKYCSLECRKEMMKKKRKLKRRIVLNKKEKEILNIFLEGADEEGICWRNIKRLEERI